MQVLALHLESGRKSAALFHPLHSAETQFTTMFSSNQLLMAMGTQRNVLGNSSLAWNSLLEKVHPSSEAK